MIFNIILAIIALAVIGCFLPKNAKLHGSAQFVRNTLLKRFNKGIIIGGMAIIATKSAA